MNNSRPDIPFVPTVAAFSAPDTHNARENRALICVRDESWRRAANAYLDARGFQVDDGPGRQMDLSMTVYGRFDLVMVQIGTECDPVLSAVHSWTGAWRRFLNLIALGEEGESLDDALAFRLGVNTYLRLSDAARADALLEIARQRYLEMVNPWMEIFRLK